MLIRRRRCDRRCFNGTRRSRRFDYHGVGQVMASRDRRQRRDWRQVDGRQRVAPTGGRGRGWRLTGRVRDLTPRRQRSRRWRWNVSARRDRSLRLLCGNRRDRRRRGRSLGRGRFLCRSRARLRGLRIFSRRDRAIDPAARDRRIEQERRNAAVRCRARRALVVRRSCRRLCRRVAAAARHRRGLAQGDEHAHRADHERGGRRQYPANDHGSPAIEGPRFVHARRRCSRRRRPGCRGLGTAIIRCEFEQRIDRAGRWRWNRCVASRRNVIGRGKWRILRGLLGRRRRRLRF